MLLLLLGIEIPSQGGFILCLIIHYTIPALITGTITKSRDCKNSKQLTLTYMYIIGIDRNKAEKNDWLLRT